MKQLGFFLVGMGILATLAQLFSVNLKGVGWEILLMLVGVFASLGIPESKKLLDLALHWRIAIIIAILSTFFMGWLFFYSVLPEKSYAIAATCVTFGGLAFLFHWLDNKKKNG